jgi:hypothetical protein
LKVTPIVLKSFRSLPPQTSQTVSVSSVKA